MRIFRVIFNFLFIAFLCFSLIACTNSNMKTTEGIVFEKIADKDEYAVIDYTGTSADVYIGETYEGLPVTTIKVNAFSNFDIEIKTLNLPDTIIELENFSLSLMKLTEFRIPKHLKYFAQAFGTYKETKFIIPDDHEYLMEKSINGYQAIVTKDNSELIYVYNTINYNAVMYLPNHITIIGQSAFMYTRFSSIILSNQVETIGSYAFWGTQSTYINMPESIKHVGINAFYKSNPPTELVLPEGLNIIENGAFSNANLTKIELPSSMTYLSPYAFSNSSVDLADHNHIISIKFNSFKLTGENLTDFINYFAYSTFRHGYYPSSTVQIILPDNEDEAVLLQETLESSLEIAHTITYGNIGFIFPEITLEFVDSSE
jgi:hypothetical protein